MPRRRIKFTMISTAILAILLFSAEKPSALLFSALIHEASHVLLGLIFFGGLPRLCVSLCGLRLRWEGNGRTWEDILLSLAGPCANLIMWLLLPRDSILASYSLSLALFNLLPAEGLDGGEIIKNLSLMLFGERRAPVVCQIFTAAAVGTLFFLSCAASLKGEFNLPLLFITLFLIIRTYGRK